MDDLKKLSVERLRELARKHLGKGHSRLRTRAQLLEALKEALREPLERLREGAESVVTAARKKVRVVDFPPGRKGKGRAEHRAQEPGSSAGSPKAPGRGQPTSRKDTPAREHERATSAAGRAASSRKTPTATPPPVAGRKETPERGTGTGA